MFRNPRTRTAQVRNHNQRMMKSVQPSAPSEAVVIDPSQVFHVGASVKGGFPQFDNEGSAREFLSLQRFPEGLQDAFVDALKNKPLRFFILDDSGSMAANDGKRVVEGGGKKRLLNCSRWDELADSLNFHVHFARDAGAPTEFRFLNNGDPVQLGYGGPNELQGVSTIQTILSGSPTNGTPLCRHIREVVAEIQAAESELRARGQKACIIIATDGESSDGDVATAMAPLRNLPAWVVVRLCTDDGRIDRYWNQVDKQLELCIDVINDLSGEVDEVRRRNPWLTYGEPIQRLREFGVSIKEIDLLDERPLTCDEMRRMAKFIYGGKLDDYPHPELEFDLFLQVVDEKNATAGLTWDPLDGRDKPWIDTRKLKSIFKEKKGCTIC